MVEAIAVSTSKILFKKKLSDNAQINLTTLETMLWGGTVLLIVDHIMNGEIVFYPPFLTGENILEEILTNGVMMSAVCTAVWGLGVLYKKFFKNVELREQATSF